ncbi:DedA family inner membrane protein [Bacteroidales bacterium]|nr:DedA family inner membrane protein [Bacteroidales bacterium]
MDFFLDIELSKLLNPEFYINNGGLWLLLFVVFAETGLFFGFFLPGDSLLFIAGIYSEKLISSLIEGGVGSEIGNLLLLIILISLCGIAGNMVGYWFGKQGEGFFLKIEDGFFYKKKYLIQTQQFYEQYGAQAIVIARFLPTIRTFAPIIAGLVKMDIRRFITYNILGSLLWVTSMTMAGHYLYVLFMKQFDINIKEHLEFIILGLFVVTSIPFIWKWIKNK